MWDTFDVILAVVAIGYSIMLFTGNAETFRKEGKYKDYDTRKLDKAFGIALFLMGIMTLVNWKFPSVEMSIFYVVFVLVDFVLACVYMQKCCKIKK